MDLNQMIVKSEMEINGELLVFYVDENNSHEGGVITSIENIEGTTLEQLQQGNYIIEDVSQLTNEVGTAETIETVEIEESNEQNTGRWTDEETRRLLVFYIDNKETFLNGSTKKKHLWAVACKTMLPEKVPATCETKLRNLKRSYTMIRVDLTKGKTFVWPYYDLCHQAFHDDGYVNMLLLNASSKQTTQVPVQVSAPVAPSNEEGIVVVKKPIPNKHADEKVEQMLNTYLKYKKSSQPYWQKHVWEKIAIEVGEDGDYWHKRFLNFKQHYIRMLEKRRDTGPESINWPYIDIFDQIFENDPEFQKKYGYIQHEIQAVAIEPTVVQYINHEWNDTEKTVLVKYCFDCLDEFQDPSIPDGFLWNEVSRLLDKTADECMKMYDELKNSHIENFCNGDYDLRMRIPLAILFDNIISKETEIKLAAISKKPGHLEPWPTEELDQLVQFFYDNVEMFKDPVCHYVCWAVISKKLNRSLQTCKQQWEDLTMLYKTILNDKKEDPDMEIDWRYIDLFERIFDYGMDAKLLEDQLATDTNEDMEEESPSKVDGGGRMKKLNIKVEDLSDDEEFEDEGTGTSGKRSRGIGDPKSFKILEYYYKNKEKFANTQRRKQNIWGVLAKQIGMSAEQCAHRFRNLKQVYIAYVQREISKPEKPILWPYYSLCKKVFGYRALKNKLKSGKADIYEEWTAKEIKQVINHFAKNFEVIEQHPEDLNVWISLAQVLGKVVVSCRDKFLELRKSYMRVKTVMRRSPESKVNWKYLKMFDEIYSGMNVVEAMDVDTDEESLEKADTSAAAVKIENTETEDDDYQCLIVMPDGQTIAGVPNAEIILKGNQDQSQEKPKIVHSSWLQKNRKKLLELYLEYVLEHKGKVINTVEMWKELATHFPKKNATSCRRVYSRLKFEYRNNINDPKYKKSKYCELLKQIFAAKPKYYRPEQEFDLNAMNPSTVKDVLMASWKIEEALRYYLEHLEEFINPKYSANHAWKELANSTSLTVSRVYKKITFIKQYFNSETNEVASQKVEYGDLVRQIFEKEFALRILIDSQPKPSTAEVEDDADASWTDEEIDQLLHWYLNNLDKFKNPKYVTSYLWMEAPQVLGRSAVACSEKMSQIRTQYSSMVKENPDLLPTWRYYELCQKIYGTGKRSVPNNE